MNLDLSRQRDIIKGRPEQYRLLFIGAGGIGSNAAWVAASMGFEHLIVYDPGIVEAENIAPQFYWLGDVVDDLEKVSSLKNSIELMLYNDTKEIITPHVELYTDQVEAADIVIIGTDSIRSRREIWKDHQIEGVKYWIDGRMGNTSTTIICVDMKNKAQRAEYEREYLANWNPVPLACGLKATAYMTKGNIPGLIGTVLRKIVNEERVPFSLFYDSEMIHLSVQWDAAPWEEK